MLRTETATAVDPDLFVSRPVVRAFHSTFVRVEYEPLPKVAPRVRMASRIRYVV